jgi:hypothetical protein
LLCNVQARKEKNADIFEKLETTLKAAMEAKQETLRPEIQLLNALLAAPGKAERLRVSPLCQRTCATASSTVNPPEQFPT